MEEWVAKNPATLGWGAFACRPPPSTSCTPGRRLKSETQPPDDVRRVGCVGASKECPIKKTLELGPLGHRVLVAGRMVRPMLGDTPQGDVPNQHPFVTTIYAPS